jgi:dnd system-associated protein 4
MPPATFFYEQNEAVEQLAAGEDAIFESRTPFLVFAASVGYNRDHWVENHDEDGEMRWNYIGQNKRLAMITAALAYAHTEDPDAISDPETQINVLTSFAAGGARILKREIVDEPGRNLDNLITFIQDHRKAKETEKRVGVLEQIENEVSSFRSSE